MKNYNKILEAIDRGIQLALDDFDDEEQVQNIRSKQVQNRDYTKEYLDLMEEVVDLGLPSGTLWLKYNLGATCGNTAESWYGDYYAFGEIEPKPKNIRKTSWKKYKFFKKFDYLNRPIFTKYVTKHKDAHGYDITYVDDLTQLLLEDDAAYQFDNRFQMTSVKQLEELMKLETEWVNNYNNVKGLNGTIFKGENGNEIFFPYAGVIMETGKKLVGSTAYMLSNEIAELNLNPICLGMNGNQYGTCEVITNNSLDRYEAFSIRPVLIKK